MPPLAIAAGIGAVASIGGGLLSASATKKAANKASDTALQTANQNNALTREIYGQNSANLQPFMQSGGRANALLDNLLYGYQPSAPQTSALGYVPPSGVPYQGMSPSFSGGQFAPQNMREGAGIYNPYEPTAPVYSAAQAPYAAPQGSVTTALPPATGMNAWDAFRNSTNYQFRLGEGLKGANQGYAARGTLQSGAALRGINNYAQNFASNELGNWMNMLAGQQNLGLSGASALAGVGQNMVNNVTANNNSAGSAAANAALMSGQANANMYGSAASALGSFAGSLGSSFGGSKPGGSINSPWYIGATPYGGAF